MNAKLDDIAERKESAEEPAELQAARKLVHRPKKRGQSLTRPDGVLKQLIKSELEAALNDQRSSLVAADSLGTSERSLRTISLYSRTFAMATPHTSCLKTGISSVGAPASTWSGRTSASSDSLTPADGRANSEASSMRNVENVGAGKARRPCHGDRYKSGEGTVSRPALAVRTSRHVVEIARACGRALSLGGPGSIEPNRPNPNLP
jgi:hypothetical protein